MKRFEELIRKVLEYGEEHAEGKHKRCFPNIEGYTPLQVHEHLALCAEEGLMEIEIWGKAAGVPPPGAHSIVRLTARGHRELQRLRDADSP